MSREGSDPVSGRGYKLSSENFFSNWCLTPINPRYMITLLPGLDETFQDLVHAGLVALAAGLEVFQYRFFDT